MLRYACIVLIAAVMASAGRVEYQTCDDTTIGLDVVVRVDGVADGTTSVTLVKGQTYQLEIEFTTTTDSATLESKLGAEIAGIYFPWNGVDADACKSLISGSCPLKAGTRYIYRNSIAVAKAYPTTSLMIVWKLIDAAEKNHVCFHLPAKIANS